MKPCLIIAAAFAVPLLMLAFAGVLALRYVAAERRRHWRQFQHQRASGGEAIGLRGEAQVGVHVGRGTPR